jgi:non-heme chloroperoxidase
VKETIVMIHGMWGTARIWDRFRTWFEAAGHRCIVPTLRFHDLAAGAAPDPALGRTSLVDYVDDLAGEIQRLREPPVIMGHSMGGLLAQMLGARGLAKSLVLLAPAPPAGLLYWNTSAVLTLLSEVTRPGFWKKPVRVTFGECARGIFNRCPEEQRTELYAAWVHESGRATFETAFWYLDRRRTSTVDESRVTCPVMMLAGKDDRLVPLVIARRIAKKYPTMALYRELDGHAHMLQVEPGWEKIAATAKDWIEGDGRR